MCPFPVVAGILTDPLGRVLVSQRLPGKPMAGRWEFPGGKLERGEDRLAGLKRELEEELGVSVLTARPLIRFVHAYPGLAVSLDIWRIGEFAGLPSGRQGQALRWIEPAALPELNLLEADRPIVTAIALPDRYLITGPPFDDEAVFLARLDAALERGIQLVQLRLPGVALLSGRLRRAGRSDGPAAYRERAIRCLARCRSAGARLLLNGPPRPMTQLAGEIGADGIHVPARYLESLRNMRCARPQWIGASCHDARELELAERAGADFAVLGPIGRTASHPESEPIGWQRFTALVEPTRMPVYALGGMQSEKLPQAWAAGAQGIAAIRSLWAPR